MATGGVALLLGASGTLLSVPPAAATSDGPALAVNAKSDLHAISPLIYGMNSYSITKALAKTLRVSIERWGGDATSRYNWKQDSSNAGADWYFMSGSGVAHPTPSGGPDALVESDRSAGALTDVTIPIIPWINKSSATNCSFPTSVYGQQQSVNPYYTGPNGSKCGNGLTPSGQAITDTDITRNNTPNSPAFEAAWVRYLVKKFGNAAHGGVAVYQMDNEPSGWGNTHRDVHPGPTGWDELVGFTERYAAAVKAVDPTAAIDGPGDFGWAAYVDAGKPGDDRASHGGKIWEAQYYLQQMAKYQKVHGVRLLDYFDEHYYPTTPNGLDGCIALCEAGDASVRAARLQATRSLWDPSYVEKDWIGQWYGATDLIPRMKSWVAKYYPGTKTAITEYNFGALDSMNGALAEADVLGIFGAQDLDMADLWGPPTATQPGAYAFAMYRNYDGRGDGFGNVSVHAHSANQSKLSVYAASRSSDGALTVMVINKTGAEITSSLSVGGFAASPAAQVYLYSPAHLSEIVKGPAALVAAGRLAHSYPANSITLLVIPKVAGKAPAGRRRTPPLSPGSFVAAPAPARRW